MKISSTPRTVAGKFAIEIYSDVLERVRADRLVADSLTLDGDRLTIQQRSYSLSQYRRMFICSVGKASIPMARAVQSILGSRVSGGIVITKDGHAEPLPGLIVLETSHPVPDDRSLIAGARMVQFARQCRADDLVIFLLSGGASSLMESLIDGISLTDLQNLNDVLLASGADISFVNSIRSRISRIKAGRLARAFGEATVMALVLSDVIGNSLASIGSGPLFPPGLISKIPDSLLCLLPPAIRQELLTLELFGPRLLPIDGHIEHFVIGSVSLAVHEAVSSAIRHGLEPMAYQDPMQGEAREMARKIASFAKRKIETHSGLPFCFIFGGETTVTIRGTGKGGRCQEMAVAALPQIGKMRNTAFLAAGTDGTDGPTDAAGGLVESGSETIAKRKGLSYRSALVNNDSYPFLHEIGGIVKTGPTGSNVNDLCLIVHAP